MGRGAAERDGALVDRLAASIQAEVLAGELPSGSRLRQETLAARFGVSRTPVREALRKLQASGLVMVEPNRGAIVRVPSPREVREAYVVRAELEGLAAELAALRIRDSELQQLHDAQELFRRAADELVAWRRAGRTDEPPEDAHADWIRGNDFFHVAIQEAAGNERLRTMLSDLHGSFPRNLTWIVLDESAHLLEENVAQHGAILHAIEARDPTEARRQVKHHVLHAGELVVRRIEHSAG
jgi:DNA-binding GntR family transcriptional regulator